MNMHSIALRIIARRRELGLTQSDLAARASISRRTLVELESGDGSRDIGMRKLERILNVLGLSLSIDSASPRPTEDELSAIFAKDED